MESAARPGTMLSNQRLERTGAREVSGTDLFFARTPRNFTNPKFHKNRTDGEMFQPGLAMNTYCGGRSSRPARLFSLGLLDVPQGTPASSSLPRSHGGLRSQPPPYGLPGLSGVRAQERGRGARD